MHVHVICADGEAKYWLEPEIRVARSYNLSPKQLRDIAEIVEERKNELIDAWQEHFNN